MQLCIAEAERLAKGPRVNAPLVVRAGQRAGAVDHDLAQSRLDQSTSTEDARPDSAHPAREPIVDHQGAKQT
jgi:hypothetical protein